MEAQPSMLSRFGEQSDGENTEEEEDGDNEEDSVAPLNKILLLFLFLDISERLHLDAIIFSRVAS
jgi:hypothetical protein